MWSKSSRRSSFCKNWKKPASIYEKFLQEFQKELMQEFLKKLQQKFVDESQKYVMVFISLEVFSAQ